MKQYLNLCNNFPQNMLYNITAVITSSVSTLHLFSANRVYCFVSMDTQTPTHSATAHVLKQAKPCDEPSSNRSTSREILSLKKRSLRLQLDC